jgi:hypothetical protein
MLLIILGLFWVAILVPVVVRRFRDSGTEKSIHSFHQEHEMMSRQEFAVPPAHRLDPEPREAVFQGLESRPRLTVVHENDTYRSLESRTSWDEWDDDYDYERDDQHIYQDEPVNRYVTAYSSVPNEREVREVRNSYQAPPGRATSMKARRQATFLLLAASAVVLSGLSFVVGYSLLKDLALLAWMGLIFYVALALFAVSQGFLYESSLPIRIPRGRGVARIEPLYDEDVEEFDSEFYDENDDSEWRRESPSRYAVG